MAVNLNNFTPNFCHFPAMDWSTVLNTAPGDVEGDKTLLEDVYTFLISKELPQSVEEGTSHPY